MQRSQQLLLVSALLSGLVLGIPQLYRGVAENLGGPWLPLLLGWVTVIFAVIVFLQR